MKTEAKSGNSLFSFIFILFLKIDIVDHHHISGCLSDFVCSCGCVCCSERMNAFLASATCSINDHDDMMGTNEQEKKWRERRHHMKSPKSLHKENLIFLSKAFVSCLKEKNIAFLCFFLRGIMNGIIWDGISSIS